MPGVCFYPETRPWLQDQWSWLLDNFGIKDVWTVGELVHEMRPRPKVVEAPADLPDASLVVLAPSQGRYVQGITALPDFHHPKDAIYIFGPTHGHISAEGLEGREYDAVYIPTTGHDEMYTHVAANLALYDRLIKNG